LTKAKQLKPVIRRLKRLFKLNHVRLTWLVIICLIGLAGVYKQHRAEAYQYKVKVNQELHRLRQNLFESANNHKDQLNKKTQQTKRLERRIKELEADLQAKKEQQSLIAKIVSPKVYAAEIVNGCGDNQYASFIYMKESGCNLNATNANGCYGIGQDCNGIVRTKCGADYTCQNQYFTNYVNGRYGGWRGAYDFWVSNHWY